MTDHSERDAAVARVMKRIQGRKAKRNGADLEVVACHRLTGLGFDQVERIATPMVSYFKRGVRTHRYSAKVSGDIKAIDPRTGRAVLVECKNYPNGLPFSALRVHQVDNLNKCVANRGIAILAWGDGTELHLLDWELLRAAGFRSQTSITEAMVASARYQYR